MSKKSHHFLTLWPWPLTYDLEKLIRSGHYHYQCVYPIWEQSIPWFLSYRVNTIAGGGRLRRKTITSPDPSDTGDMIIIFFAFSMSIGFSDFFMDTHDKWKHKKSNIFCRIMYIKSNNPIYTTCTFISSTMLLDGYTETTLELHWKATGWGTLKVHWNYTEMPLDGYTESTLKFHCTSSAPQLHLQRTPTAPPVHPNCTSSAP